MKYIKRLTIDKKNPQNDIILVEDRARITLGESTSSDIVIFKSTIGSDLVPYNTSTLFSLGNTLTNWSKGYFDSIYSNNVNSQSGPLNIAGFNNQVEINSDLSILGSVSVNGTFDSTSTTFNLLNQPTTIIAFNSATTIQFGSATSNATFNGGVTINGTLSVQGGQSISYSTNTFFTDSLVELHKVSTGSIAINDGRDIGIKYNYYDDVGFANVIASGSGNGTTATLVISGAPMPVGSIISVSNLNPVGFNGTYRVTASTNSSVSYENTTLGVVSNIGKIVRKTQLLTTSGSSSGTTATINYSESAILIQAGDEVTLFGITPAGYNGVFTVTNATTSSFNIQTVGADLGSISTQGKIVVGNRFAFSGFANDTNAFEFYKVGAETTASTFRGIYGTVKAGAYVAEAPGCLSSSEISTGALIRIPNNTFYDADSSAGYVHSRASAVSLAKQTIGSINTSVTYSNAATLFIEGAPEQGTNVSISNAYALEIANGPSLLNGPLTSTGVVRFTNVTASTSTLTGALVVSGGVGIAGDLYVEGNIYSKGTTSATNTVTTIAQAAGNSISSYKVNGINSTGTYIIDTVDASLFRTGRYTVQIVDTGYMPNKVHITELTVFHDGNGSNTLVYLNEYGTNHNDGLLGSFDAEYNSGIVTVTFTPNYIPVSMSTNIVRTSLQL